MVRAATMDPFYSINQVDISRSPLRIESEGVDSFNHVVCYDSEFRGGNGADVSFSGTHLMNFNLSHFSWESYLQVTLTMKIQALHLIFQHSGYVRACMLLCVFLMPIEFCIEFCYKYFTALQQMLSLFFKYFQIVYVIYVHI